MDGPTHFLGQIIKKHTFWLQKLQHLVYFFFLDWVKSSKYILSHSQ